MRVDAACAVDVYTVAMAMRDADFAEFSALNAAPDRETLAIQLRRVYGAHPDAVTAFADDGAPVAVGAVVIARPNVATLMFFATPRLAEIGQQLTRFIRRRLLPAYVARGVHRVECVSMAGHDDAHRWIRTLGLSREAECRGYGKAGETFYQFAWVAPHVR